MNGAESLVRTLVKSGVEICFTNPGTSEMHFVAALDHVGINDGEIYNGADDDGSGSIALLELELVQG